MRVARLLFISINILIALPVAHYILYVIAPDTFPNGRDWLSIADWNLVAYGGLAYLGIWLVWVVFKASDSSSRVAGGAVSHKQLRLRSARISALLSMAHEGGSVTVDDATRLVGDAKIAQDLLEALVLEDRMKYDEKNDYYAPR